MGHALIESEPREAPVSAPVRGGRPAWAEVDLDAIAENVRALSGLVGPAVELIAVVKSNAYGHGAIAVASTAIAAGAARLAVNCVDEGIELRRAGLGCPILVLGDSPAWEAGRIVAHGLTPSVTSPALAKALDDAATARGVLQPVHLEIDTGMSRSGLLAEEATRFALALGRRTSLHLEGMFTHFSRGDEEDRSATLRQLSAFERAVAGLEALGVSVPLRHAANTAATLDLPETRLDAVRCGLGMLGLYPSPTSARAVGLRPALEIKARVARVCRFPAGTEVGYGGTFVLDREAAVALVPIGYADGLPWLLSNRGSVLIRGRRMPIVGRVSMDQTTVLIDGPAVETGDEVVVLGRQGGESLGAEELAAQAGTIQYEIVARLSPRLPRVWSRAGVPARVETLLGVQAH